jgi:putative membrane protein
MKLNRFLKQFNWRFLLVRILVNAIALAVTVAIVPKIGFVDTSIRNWLFMAIMLGVLNALVKPLLQFLTLQFIFVTFGLVLVIVNALILMLLSLMFPNQFAVDSILWAFVGGLVLGLVSSFFESLLGLTMPIVPDEPEELRQHVEAQAQRVNRSAIAEGRVAEQAQVTGTVAPSSTVPGESPDAAVPEPTAPELDAAAEAGAEPETAAEPSTGDSAPVGEAPASAESTISEGTEPPHQPQEETEEGRS